MAAASNALPGFPWHPNFFAVVAQVKDRSDRSSIAEIIGAYHPCMLLGSVRVGKDSGTSVANGQTITAVNG